MDVSLLSLPDEVILHIFDVLDVDLSRPVAFLDPRTHTALSQRPSRAAGPRHKDTAALAATCRRFSLIHRAQFCTTIDTDLPSYYRSQFASGACEDACSSPRLESQPLLRAFRRFPNASRVVYDGSLYTFAESDVLRVWSVPARWHGVNLARAQSEEARAVAFWTPFRGRLHSVRALHVSILLTPNTARALLSCCPSLAKLDICGRGYPYATAAEIPIDPSEEGCLTLVNCLPAGVRSLRLADIHMRSDGLLAGLRALSGLEELLLSPFTLSLGPENSLALTSCRATLRHLEVAPRMCLYDWSVPSLCELLASLTGLSRLRLSRSATEVLDDTFTPPDSTLEDLLVARPETLSELYVENDHMSRDFTRFPLDLTGIDSVSSLASVGLHGRLCTLQGLLPCADSLRCISITSATFQESALVDVMPHLTTLQSLRLAFCDGVSNTSVHAIFNVKSLKRLCLIGCHNLSDYGIVASLESAPCRSRMETLDFTGCEVLGDGCANAMNSFPALQELSMSETSVSTDGIWNIIERCRRLRTLYVTDGILPSVSEDGLVDIAAARSIRRASVESNG